MTRNSAQSSLRGDGWFDWAVFGLLGKEYLGLFSPESEVVVDYSRNGLNKVSGSSGTPPGNPRSTVSKFHPGGAARTPLAMATGTSGGERNHEAVA